MTANQEMIFIRRLTYSRGFIPARVVERAMAAANSRIEKRRVDALELVCAKDYFNNKLNEIKLLLWDINND